MIIIITMIEANTHVFQNKLSLFWLNIVKETHRQNIEMVEAFED